MGTDLTSLDLRNGFNEYNSIDLSRDGLARCSPLTQSSRVRQVQVKEKIIDVACTRAPATAQSIGSVMEGATFRWY